MPGRADAVEGKGESFLYRSLKSAFWCGGLFAAGAFVIAALNPFEIKTWEEMRSHETWERIHAPLVAGADLTGRNAITIVSINEETLARTGFKRPFDMATHGEILSDIIEAPRAAAIEQATKVARASGSAPQPTIPPSVPPAKVPGTPKAVFIDLVLSGVSAPDVDAPSVARTLDDQSTVCRAPNAASSKPPSFFGPKSLLCYAKTVAAYTRYADWRDDRACQSDTLAKIACIQRHGGIPILFADESRGRALGAKDMRSPALRLLDEIAVTTPVFITLPDYPLIERSEGHEARRGRFELPGEDERIRFTPATALYSAYCGAGGAPGADCRHPPWVPVSKIAVPIGVLHWSKNFTEPLDLQWATGGPSDSFLEVLRKLHPGAMTKGCSADRGFLAASKRFAERMFAGIHLAEIDPDCPYIHDLPYQDITAPDFGTKDAVDTLGGKLVLVGEELHDSPDVVNAAPNMALPGVYAHAMALDRLIVKNDDYPRKPQPSLSWLDFNSVDAGIVITVFVFFSLDRMLGLWIGFPRHAAKHGGHLDAEAAARSHLIWAWFRLTLRLMSPFAFAVGVLLLFQRQFEQSIVVVGGLAFAILGEIVVASLVTWAVRRKARFVRLFQDIKRLFAPAPEGQAHHNGEQP